MHRADPPRPPRPAKRLSRWDAMDGGCGPPLGPKMGRALWLRPDDDAEAAAPAPGTTALAWPAGMRAPTGGAAASDDATSGAVAALAEVDPVDAATDHDDASDPPFAALPAAPPAALLRPLLLHPEDAGADGGRWLDLISCGHTQPLILASRVFRRRRSRSSVTPHSCRSSTDLDASAHCACAWLRAAARADCSWRNVDGRNVRT